MALRDLISRIRFMYDPSGVKAAQDDVKGFGDTAKRETQEVNTATTQLNDTVRNLAKSYGAIQVAQFINQAAQQAQQLLLLEQTTGLTASRLNELGNVFQNTGGDISDVRGILIGLQSAITEADLGSTGFADAFRELGLEGSTLASAGIETALIDILNALKQIEDPTQRVGLASAILGDEDAGLITGRLDDIIAALTGETGLSGESIKAAADAATAFGELKTSVSETAIEIAANIANAFASPGSEGEGGNVVDWINTNFVSTSESQQAIADASARMRDQLNTAFTDPDLFDAFANMRDTIVTTQEETGTKVGGVWARIASEGGPTNLAIKKMETYFARFGVSAGGVFSRLADHGVAAMRRLADDGITEVNRLRAHIDSLISLRDFEDQLPEGASGGVFGSLQQRIDDNQLPESLPDLPSEVDNNPGAFFS